MRSIDADALMDNINERIENMTSVGVAVDGAYLWALIYDEIKKAPTIEPSEDLISRQDAIDGMNKLYQDDYEQFGELDIPECFDNDRAIEVINALPSTNRPNEYNLELIADIVRQLGHLDNYIADTYLRPNNKIHIQFENIFSDDCYFIEDDKYILAELEKIATNTEDCIEFTLTNNKKVIIHAADKPKGEWIEQYASKERTAKLAVCSECGWYDGYKAKNYNYCPNCGADMRGERNE